MQVGGSNQAISIRIGCRFVSTDQWLITHVTTSWTVGEVKSWLLAKFLPSSFTAAPDVPRAKSSRKRREMSPIRFAARQQTQFKSKRTADEYYLEDDYDEDDDDLEDNSLEAHKFNPTPRLASASSSTNLLPKPSLSSDVSSQGKDGPCIDPASYILIAFSTGQLLEDRLRLDAYSIQPGELLELHSEPFVVKLARHDPESYVQPYFEAKVRALKSVCKDAEAEFESTGKRNETDAKAAHQDAPGEPAPAIRDRLNRKRRSKLEWHDRWVVIHQGLFKLCRRRDGFKPHYESPFSALLTIAGREHLQTIYRQPKSKPSSLSQIAFSSSPSLTTTEVEQADASDAKPNWIICLKFRNRDMSSRHARPRPSLPDVNWWKKGSREENLGWGTASFDQWNAPKADSVEEDNSNEDAKDRGSVDEGVTWVVLDMLNEDAFRNFIRLIHREASPLTFSTFLADANVDEESEPPPSPILFAPRASLRRRASPTSPTLESRLSSSKSPPPPSATTDVVLPRSAPVAYPSWRLELFNRARQAGMGDIGKALEFVTFGSHNDEDESTIEHPPMTRGRQPEKTKFISEREHKNALYQQGIVFDDDSSGSSDESSSEQEWVGWMEEVSRKRKMEYDKAHDEEHGIQWETNWNWHHSLVRQNDSGSQTQESGTSSPRTDLLNLDSVDQLLASTAVHPLTSYASADSLVRRTIVQSISISRPSSPSGNNSRIRPRSPLADELDDDPYANPNAEEDPSSYMTYNPNFTYPQSHILRSPHSEPTLNPASLVHPTPQRKLVPPTMAMTEIRGSVTTGNPPEPGRKGRHRTSTLVPPKPQKPHNPASQVPPSKEKSGEKPETGPQTSSSSFGNLFSKPKLRLPAFTSGQPKGGTMSPTSTDSYESLKFATPPPSDE